MKNFIITLLALSLVSCTIITEDYLVDITGEIDSITPSIIIDGVNGNRIKVICFTASVENKGNTISYYTDVIIETVELGKIKGQFSGFVYSDTGINEVNGRIIFDVAIPETTITIISCYFKGLDEHILYSPYTGLPISSIKNRSITIKRYNHP